MCLCIFWVCYPYSCHTCSFQTHLHLCVCPFPLRVLSCCTGIYLHLGLYMGLVWVSCVFLGLGTRLRPCCSRVCVSVCKLASAEESASGWSINSSAIERSAAACFIFLQVQGITFLLFSGAGLDSFCQWRLTNNKVPLPSKPPSHHTWKWLIPTTKLRRQQVGKNFWLLLIRLTPESLAQLCEALQFLALKQDHLNHYKHPKKLLMSVTLFYFCGSEVLRNPGWIFHSWLTLSVSIFSLCFSFCLRKDVTMMKLLMDSGVTSTQWWWIAALFALCSSCLCSSVCWIDRVHKSLLEGEVLWELWPRLWCAEVT